MATNIMRETPTSHIPATNQAELEMKKLLCVQVELVSADTTNFILQRTIPPINLAPNRLLNPTTRPCQNVNNANDNCGVVASVASNKVLGLTGGSPETILQTRTIQVEVSRQ